MKTVHFGFYTFFFTISLLWLNTGCEEEPELPQLPETNSSTGVFIVNEGNFTRGNASLSFYDMEMETVSNQVFQAANNRILGDVAQSMLIIDTLGYVVVNNSGKIEVIDIQTFENTATITGFVSPRYMALGKRNMAWVTDLYSNTIQIIDLTNNAITNSIGNGKTTEQIITAAQKVFVANWSYSNTIQVFDIETFELLKTIEVAPQPNSMVLDKDGKLWILSDGATAWKSGAALSRIDTETLQVERELPFANENDSPTRLTTNANADSLFFLNHGVFAMSINAGILPEAPLIPEGEKLFYGLGVDPSNSQIYVSDAIDYEQQGQVYRYSPQGVLIDSFKAGVIPSFFCFIDLTN